MRIESCNVKRCLARIIRGINVSFKLKKDFCTPNRADLSGPMQWTGSIDGTFCIGDKTFLEHISEAFWIVVQNDVVDD